MLIVGADSYIGTSFERYVQGRLDVTTISSLDDEWWRIDCSGFDSVVCLAGIAHRKQTAGIKDLYFSVNRDLAVEVADKVKSDGVKQFIYFSSMAVYGRKTGEITEHSIPSPINNDFYGLSKFEAEKLIEPMQTDGFLVAIVRPPMVYGPNCKGKFPSLVRISRMSPFIPTFDNQRSMIFIDNLTEFLATIIEQGCSGVFCPQNKYHVSTARIMEEITISAGKKPVRMPVLNLFIRLFLPVCPPLRNAFGSLYYSAKVSDMPFEHDYQVVGFEESIRRSLGNPK